MGILTTVVGSYPIPHWLLGDASRTTLRDAIMVVLKTQELAGIDVVADFRSRDIAAGGAGRLEPEPVEG